MTPTSAARRIPFWILLVASLASAGYGFWLTSDKISTMESGLADNSATAVDVYAGQSWATLGAAFLAAGLIGLFAALAVWTIGSRLGGAAPVISEVPVSTDLAATRPAMPWQDTTVPATAVSDAPVVTDEAAANVDPTVAAPVSVDDAPLTDAVDAPAVTDETVSVSESSDEIGTETDAAATTVIDANEEPAVAFGDEPVTRASLRQGDNA
ncbi:tetraspanin family protein [Microbacterium gorillae]|uniref:hypothetical protein n=1 Tax=Microbacterium gorillae TaxID=1231063 RepID=UPI0006933BF1|nr:hypothetical protein [Microbacterium gorillae]